MAWQELVAAVEATVTERGDGEVDTLLFTATCKSGHETRIMGLASTAVDLADPTAGLVRGLEACSSCKEPATVTLLQRATFVPLANGTVLMRAARAPKGDFTVAFAFWPLDGAPVDVPVDHAAVQEVPPATATAIATSSMSDLEVRERGTRLEAVLRADAAYAPAWVALAQVATASGDANAAEAHARRAVAAAPDFAAAHFALGDALQERQANEDALESFDAAIALNPRLLPALNQRGTVLFRLGRDEDAWRAYVAVLAVDPHSVPTLGNAAARLYQAGRLAEAVAVLGDVPPSGVQDQPAVHEQCFGIAAEAAMNEGKRGNLGVAARACAVAHGFAPEHAGLLTLWAQVLATQGAFVDAKARAWRALELEPGNEAAERLVIDLDAAKAVTNDQIGAFEAHSVAFVDSAARPAVGLNVPVTAAFREHLVYAATPAPRLADDQALSLLLALKGHNARVPQGLEGRPFVWVVNERPDDGFVALAQASAFRAKNGTVVPSVPVPIDIGIGDGAERVALSLSKDPVALDRVLPADVTATPERFFGVTAAL